jgi:hypothetical protein
MDYNFLKHMIKIHTTPEHEGGVRIPIPGCVDEDALKFERQFYAEVCQSYDGVSLFVFSKAGELDRRLGAFLPFFFSISYNLSQTLHPSSSSSPPIIREFKAPPPVIIKWSDLPPAESLSRSINELALNPGPNTLPTPTSSALVSGLYLEQRQCDHDIRRLQQFIHSQLTAFGKILKKYKRWTGSSALDLQFKNQLRYHPRDLVKLNIQRLQSRCDAILADLRPRAASFRSFTSLDSMNSAEISANSPSCLLDAATSNRVRVAASSRSSLLLGSSIYWNEYDWSSDVEDGFQKTNDGWFINIRSGVEVSTPSQHVLSIFWLFSVFFTLKIGNRRRGSTDTSADSDTTSSGRLSPTGFSSYGTMTTARAVGSAPSHLVGPGDVDSHNGPARRDQEVSHRRSDGVDADSVSGDDFSLSSDEGGATTQLTYAWLCLGAAVFLSCVIAPFILTGGHTTRRVGYFASATSGIMVSFSAACAAPCIMLSCEDFLGRVAKLLIWVAFLLSGGANSALLVLLLRDWDRPL